MWILFIVIDTFIDSCLICVLFKGSDFVFALVYCKNPIIWEPLIHQKESKNSTDPRKKKSEDSEMKFQGREDFVCWGVFGLHEAKMNTRSEKGIC